MAATLFLEKVAKKKSALGRIHIGIYTVLNASFPLPQPSPPLKYIQYFFGF